MREIFQIRLQEEQYRVMLERYHFRQTDAEQLRCLGVILEQLAGPVMYFAPCNVIENGRNSGIHMLAGHAQCGGTAEWKEGMQLAVLVSLGNKVDALQNEYVRRERLTEGYMIECIGMELLQTAYEKVAEIIRQKYGLWMSGFEFLGDRYPLEWTKDLFHVLQPEGITYNQAYMMTPKKTVAFLTALRQERKESYCHVCESCSNLQCPNRQKLTSHMNYGYQRIFGKP